jgi:hypothetical protein
MYAGKLPDQSISSHGDFNAGIYPVLVRDFLLNHGSYEEGVHPDAPGKIEPGKGRYRSVSQKSLSS